MHPHTIPRRVAPAALAVVLALLASCAGAPPPKPSQPVPPAVLPEFSKPEQAPQPQQQEPPTAAAPNAEAAKLESVRQAAILLEQGDANKAVEKLSALAVADPSAPDLRRLKAAALASAGKLSDARVELDAILAILPGDLESLTMAADISRFQGDDKGRRAYLDSALAVNASDGAVLAAWGQLYLDQKSWALAEDAFRRSSLANPKNPDAFQGLGQALYRLGRYADSETALNQALILDPKNAFAYSDRSKTRYQLGKYIEAEVDLGSAISIAPDSAWAWLDRGRLRLDANRLVEAETDLSTAIKLDPGYFLAYVYRAALYDKTGRDALALADYDRITSLEPGYWYSLESAGACAFRLGLWGEAANRFLAAWNHARERYDYPILSIIALMHQGKMPEGRALAAKVAPGVDREKYQIQWLMLRLLQDQNDLSTELEARIQSEKRLDMKAAMLFYLGEYWIIRGKIDLGTKYLIVSREMKREGSFEYRLLSPELARINAAGGHG